MKLDISRFNISEKDIENYLFEYPGELAIDAYIPWRIDHWLMRQYRLPSGIADLVGITTGGNLAVIEVKNVPADSRAITQVCRYAHDIGSIIAHRPRYGLSNQDGFPVLKAIVAPSIESLTTYYEARACGVHLHEFTSTLNLDVYCAYPDNSADAHRYADYREDIERIAQGKEWDRFGHFYSNQDLYEFGQWKEHQQEMLSDGGDAEHF